LGVVNQEIPGFAVDRHLHWTYVQHHESHSRCQWGLPPPEKCLPGCHRTGAWPTPGGSAGAIGCCRVGHPDRRWVPGGPNFGREGNLRRLRILAEMSGSQSPSWRTSGSRGRRDVLPGGVRLVPTGGTWRATLVGTAASGIRGHASSGALGCRTA